MVDFGAKRNLNDSWLKKVRLCSSLTEGGEEVHGAHQAEHGHRDATISIGLGTRTEAGFSLSRPGEYCRRLCRGSSKVISLLKGSDAQALTCGAQRFATASRFWPAADLHVSGHFQRFSVETDDVEGLVDQNAA